MLCKVLKSFTQYILVIGYQIVLKIHNWILLLWNKNQLFYIDQALANANDKRTKDRQTSFLAEKIPSNHRITC